MPNEAGMKLMREPHAFNLHTSRHIMRLMGRSTISGGSICFIRKAPVTPRGMNT